MPPLALSTSGGTTTVRGDGFAYTFDSATGTLESMQVESTELLARGPRLDVWRAPIDNENVDWRVARHSRGTGWGSTASSTR